MWMWFDGLTSSLLDPTPNPLFPGFLGTLDAAGTASASMNLSPIAPLPLGLSGWRVHFAPALIVGNTAIAGPPLEIVLR